MRSLRLALGAAVLVALAAGLARAQTAAATTTFVAVDGIRYQYSMVYVTGVVQGEATSREVHFYRDPTNAALLELQRSCERFLLLAMEKPGQYLVTVEKSSSSPPYMMCSLARVNP